MHVPFISLEPQHHRIRAEFLQSFGKVLDGGRLILGEEVKAFEREWADYHGVKYCVAVANGSDAIYISLKALGIGEGDEVIVPALTCAPTWMAAHRTGARLVAVEADPETFMISPHKISDALSRLTKAIVPVNLYGHPADLPAIVSLADAAGVAVVEDNAQGHGATWNSRKTGSFGLVNGTSFYPTKNLGALGDGGAITTDNEGLAEKARRFRNYGSVKRFENSLVGINSRLDEMQAGFLRIKLKYLESWNEERKRIAGTYISSLSQVGDLLFPRVDRNAEPVYHLFVVCTAYRDSLREFLLTQGVESDVHYPFPPHLQEAFASLGHRRGSFPVTEKISDSIMSLPVWPGLSDGQVEHVCKSIGKFFERFSGKR